MAGRRRVVWTEPAKRLLFETVEFLSRPAPVAAEQFAEEVEHAAASRSHLPDRGREVPELAGSGIREIFVRRYRLMYAVGSDDVRIVTFVHGARDARRALRP